MKRRTLLSTLATATIALVACVLVEPPQELPVPAPRRPVIVQTSLQPPARLDQPITDLDTTLVAYVDAEPTKTLNYRVWIDYGGDQAVQNCPDGCFKPPDANGNTRRLIEIPLVPLAVGDPRFCHTITLFVAYDFIEGSQTPAGDSDYVTWYYRPNGNLGSCIGVEAGVPDAAVPDASDGAVE